jgi:cyclic beta-1,2-glucan synthetase
MQHTSALSNTTGSVLDPIVSLRRTFGLAPGDTIYMHYILGATESRDAALGLVEKYLNPRTADQSFDLAENQSQVTLRQLGATEADLQIYERLASALIYSDPTRRAAASVLIRNRRGKSALWRYGISGDIPIVLLRIGGPTKIAIVKPLIQAHSFWRTKALAVDLVILNEDVSESRQHLHDTITSLIVSGGEEEMLDKPGGIFVRRLEQVCDEDQVLLQSVARIVLTDESGLLAEQLDILDSPGQLVPASAPTPSALRDAPRELAPRELIFHNGLGGFTPDGREYVITLQQTTPAPWVNVLANPYFGTVISESGSAYTWAENSHEFRLTPWSNDPVTDASGEAFYIRDEQSGYFWSPTPLPARGATAYVIRHGFGYSIFEHTENGIISELTVCVAIDAPVKIVILKLRNVSGHPRKISIVGYWEWVLGDSHQKNSLHVQTEVDLKTGALLARNFYNTEFSERIAFVDVDDPARTLTGDRNEFLGRNGALWEPAGLKGVGLSGKTGAGLDPCGALKVTFDLLDGQEREIAFRLWLVATWQKCKIWFTVFAVRRPAEQRSKAFCSIGSIRSAQSASNLPTYR